MELKKINNLFNDCYKLYKHFIQTELNDNDLQEVARSADVIYKRYNTDFAKEMLISVINEIDRVEKRRSTNESENQQR